MPRRMPRRMRRNSTDSLVRSTKLDRNNTTEKKTSAEPIPECDCHRSYEHYQHWGTGIFPCDKGIRFCHWRGVARQSATTDIRCSQALADPIFPTFTAVSKYLTERAGYANYMGGADLGNRVESRSIRIALRRCRPRKSSIPIPRQNRSLGYSYNPQSRL